MRSNYKNIILDFMLLFIFAIVIYIGYLFLDDVKIINVYFEKLNKIDFTIVITTITSLFTISFSFIMVLFNIKQGYYGINILRVFLFYNDKTKIIKTNISKIINIFILLILSSMCFVGNCGLLSYILIIIVFLNVLSLLFDLINFISSNQLIAERTEQYIIQIIGKRNDKEKSGLKLLTKWNYILQKANSKTV